MLFSLAFLAIGAEALWPNICISAGNEWNQTRCPADFTCAPNGFSGTGLGCAPFPNATICDGYQSCPADTTCNLISGSGYSTVYRCLPKSGGQVSTSKCSCKPGVPLPLDAARKNVVIIGDSLTIGYTPIVARLLSDIALVQHVPWNVVIIGDSPIGYTPIVARLLSDIALVQHVLWDTSDGGAEETEYGLQCLDIWLASPSGMPIRPDMIYFNFGMHDYVTSCTPGHGCVPGQSGNTTVYPGELEAIARKLQKFAGGLTPPAKLMFGITSPDMCNAAIDQVISGTLNVAAARIMQNLNIPTVDLHAAVVGWCGGPAPMSSCKGISQCFCPHCSATGYEMLASTLIAPAIRRELTAATTTA